MENERIWKLLKAAADRNDGREALKVLGFTEDEVLELGLKIELTEEEKRNIGYVCGYTVRNGEVIWELTDAGNEYIFSDQKELNEPVREWHTECVPFKRFSHYYYEWVNSEGETMYTGYAWYNENESYVDDFKTLDDCLEWLVSDLEIVVEKDKLHVTKEPFEKVSVLCEEHEWDDGIREFNVVAVSKDKDALKRLMKSEIAKDGYGVIGKNGVFEHDEDHFCTNFDEGFVEYYISDEWVLPEKEVEKMIGEKANDLVEEKYISDGTSVLRFECNCKTEEDFAEMMDAVHKEEAGVNFWTGARLWYKPKGVDETIMVEHQISTREAAIVNNGDDPEWDGSNEPDWLTAYKVDDEFDDDVSCEIFTETIEDNIKLAGLMDEMVDFAKRVFERFYVKEGSLDATLSAAAKQASALPHSEQCPPTREQR